MLKRGIFCLAFFILDIMRQQLVLFMLFTIPELAYAQLGYDANWVFGKGSGIDFNVPIFPITYQTLADNFEPNASISDSNGTLQLYITQHDAQSTAWIMSNDNTVILNGQGILLNNSATNGAVFLPVPGNKDLIFLFHIATYSQSCSHARCYRLYFTSIGKNNQHKWEVLNKNTLLSTEVVEESLALVKHANGIDWWLLIREQRLNQPGACSNKILKFTISNNGISGPLIQNIKGGHCSLSSYIGETSVSINGDYLASAAMNDSIFFYKINRCNGDLEHEFSIHSGLQNYGLAIFERKLYVGGSTLGSGSIHEYNLDHPNPNDTKKTLWVNNIPDLEIGQFEPCNNKILVAMMYVGIDSLYSDTFSHHLSAILFPGTDSATVAHGSFYMGSQSRVAAGLPSFPNYNLGPEGVFLASAGMDTFWCSNTGTGVTIGAPPVPNVIYSWQPGTGLSATDVARPVASPAQGTWYHLTATDTTATGCAVNTDSVYVGVRACVGIGEGPAYGQWDYRLLPNLFGDERIGKVTLGTTERGALKVYSIDGRLAGDFVLGEGENRIDLSKTLVQSSVYIYRVVIEGEVKRTDRLVMVAR